MLLLSFERLHTILRFPLKRRERLRDVINKNVTQEEVIRTCTKAFDNGWTSVKLYFMMGLPNETMEDIEGIANLGMDVIHAFYNNPNRQKGTGVQVSISCASFIPKPFTPFRDMKP